VKSLRQVAVFAAVPFLLATPACLSGGLADPPPASSPPGAHLVPGPIDHPAEGFGAISRGGAGGRLIQVTHLGATGPGSLREALEAQGPRIIRFNVGGVIHLEERILVRAGRVTLDGASAARHGGITVAGGGLVFVECEDVIVRHIRLRGGYDPLSLIRSRRVLVDHVSTAWASDENMDAWGSEDVTFQWSILAEALVEGGHEKGPHSMGSLQGGGAHRITTHHCLFTGNVDRNPMVYGPRPVNAGGSSTAGGPWRFDVVNNLIYNYWNGAKARYGAQVNFIGNHFIPGPQTSPHRAALLVSPSEPPAVLFLQDNLAPVRGPDDLDLAGLWLPDEQAPDGLRRYSADWFSSGKFPQQYLSSVPFGTPPEAQVQGEDVEQVLKSVLAAAGAWPRDADDLRLVTEVREGTGRIGRYGDGWRKVYQLDREGGDEDEVENE
jgi:hypothetical protein